MTLVLSDAQTLLLRLRGQRLSAREAGSSAAVASITKGVCGVQAQDERAAALSVSTRGTILKANDVERALVEERSIVRTWCMRGTLHLLPAEDVGWLMSLYGPVFIAKSRRRYQQLRLDEDTCARGVRFLQSSLSVDAPLTRAQIVELLAPQEIQLSGQASYHFLRRAALQGVLCFGPTVEGEPTYVLLQEWIQEGARMKREAALLELATRYLLGYAPAGFEDLVTWSGLPAGDLRAAWRDLASQAIEVKVGNTPALVPRSHEPWLKETKGRVGAPVVRLLPSFDTYLLGYRDRALVVASRYAKHIHPGGGVLHPTLVVDGRASGTWRLDRRSGGLDVVVQPFEKLAHPVRDGLDSEANRVSEFLGEPATLIVHPPITT